VTVSLAEAQYTVGEEDEEVTVCVQLEEGALGGITATVDYQILPGSASLADYLGPRVGSLSLGPEAVTGDTACLTIPLVNDSIHEPPETLTLSLRPSSAFVVIGANSSATITIIDDDGALAAVGMESVEYMFSEGDGVIVVCAVLEDGDLGSISEIPFSVEDDTASGNIDYLLPQTLVFRFPLMSPVGQPACVEFTLVNDNIVEDMRTFEIRLTPLPGVTVGTNGFAFVTIVDDDWMTVSK
ncbi:Adhesion G-protein coupled receptor V1, partial [Geodia barretti]